MKDSASRKILSAAAITALSLSNSFLYASEVEGNNLANEEKKAQLESSSNKEGNLRINASFQESSGSPSQVGIGFFKPLTSSSESIWYSDFMVNYDYEEIYSSSDHSFDEDKSGFSTSTRLGRRFFLDNDWIGGINAGIDTRSINYGNADGFTNAAIEIELLSDDYKILAHGNFSLGSNRSSLRSTSSSTITQTTVSPRIFTTTTTDTTTSYVTPVNQYGLTLEKTINENFSLSLGGHYLDNYAEREDGIGVNLSFTYTPGEKTKITTGAETDPIFDTRLYGKYEHKFNNIESQKNKNLNRIPSNREIPLKIYSNVDTSVEEVITITDPSSASLDIVPASSMIAQEYTADELINFNDISYA